VFVILDMLHRRGAATETFRRAEAGPVDTDKLRYRTAAAMGLGVGVLEGVLPGEMVAVGEGVGLEVAVSVGSADSLAEVLGEAVVEAEPLLDGDVDPLDVGE
jgi:hypothetical protein